MQIETRHSAIRRQIREAEQAERLADDRCDFQEHQRQIEKLWALYALEQYPSILTMAPCIVLWRHWTLSVSLPSRRSAFPLQRRFGEWFAR